MAETMLDSDRVNVPQRLPVLVASFLSLVRCHNQVPWDELKTQLGAKEAAWKRGKSYYGLDCLESCRKMSLKITPGFRRPFGILLKRSAAGAVYQGMLSLFGIAPELISMILS